MSNVLIGIIGVILFIGLALAGALFLGPRFQEASLNSKDAASLQAVSQISNASRMYAVQEGRPIPSNPSGTTLNDTDSEPYVALVGGGYLKSIPSNPYSYGSPYVGRIGDHDYALMGLGTDPETCARINKQLGHGADGSIYFDQDGKSNGCVTLGETRILWEKI